MVYFQYFPKARQPCPGRCLSGRNIDAETSLSFKGAACHGRISHGWLTKPHERWDEGDSIVMGVTPIVMGIIPIIPPNMVIIPIVMGLI